MTENMPSNGSMSPGWSVPSFDEYCFAGKSKDYCLCIPVINEGERIKQQLLRLKTLSVFEAVDICIADGGSRDGSLEHGFLEECQVRTLLIKTGPGKLSAQLRMAYAFALKAGYNGIVTMDGNNKDDGAAVFDFVHMLSQGYDLIQGSRYVKGGNAVNTPLSRMLAVKLIHIPVISLLAGFRYTDTTNGFRGYSRSFLLDERVQPFRDIFDTYELLAYLSVKGPRLGYRVTEIPVTRAYPRGEATPTKISSIRGNFDLLKILWLLMLNRYDPDA